jgi:superfamily II DNA or RNA helicase
MTYQSFINKKLAFIKTQGIDRDCFVDDLFPHQKVLTNWALRKGRAAIFADTGLGKSRMQIAWADAVSRTQNRDVLILAPLAVADQTVEEGANIGVRINHAHDDSGILPGINITNYDRLHKFDTDRFGGVVLDESSIIKHSDSKTLKTLLESFAHTPYKLCATATPAPNDYTELGTHSEFLGVRTQSEMLAEYFVHDGGETQKWRLKGHAKQEFWRWVSSWGALVRNPADLGFDGAAYLLPDLHVHQHTIETDPFQHGQMFAVEAQTLTDRRNARRSTIERRVKACADIVNNDPSIWLIWCDLNAEADALKAAIPDAVEIRGPDSEEHKVKSLMDFAHGKIRVLISKPKICGFGLNFQACSNMAFVGVTDSFESYYQAVRRCWRFGQKKPVHVHVFASDIEGAVVANLHRKEREVLAMGEQLSAEVRESIQLSVLGTTKEHNKYIPAQKIIIPNFIV